jgi:hypothetical protein
MLFSLSLTSCRWRKGFSTFKRPIYSQKNQSNSLKINGLYYSETSIYSFYLYSHGLFKTFVSSSKDKKEFVQNPDPHKRNSDFDKELWGQYYINNDTLFIQYFYRIYQSVPKRYLVEKIGVILNDSTINMKYEANKEYPKRLDQGLIKELQPNQVYRFYPTKSKPDSTTAWFLNKKWYQQGLHPSRR